MRVLFMGTPDFAVPTLEALLRSRHEVVAVVCQPDKTAGRNRKLTAPPVKQAAEEKGIPVLQPKYLKSRTGARQKQLAEEWAEYKPDIGVVVAYGKILPREILELPKHGCLNVHASLLPKYRGAAPVNWAIVNGETETGVSIMQMDEGLDTGDVLAMDKVEILPDDNALSVLNVLSVMGAHALVEVLDAIESGRKMEVRRQADMGESSYAPLMTKEDGWIDWTQTTEEIICHINGFQPWPGAYAKFESGDQMAMNQAQPWEGDWPAYSNEADPGQVLDRVKGKGFLVKTGSGILLLTRVKPKSKDEMDAFSTWNGKYVDEKTTFVSPKKKIIESTESV